MSSDNNENYRKGSLACEVVSKYFTHNLVMEESSVKVKKEKQCLSNSKAQSSKGQKRPKRNVKGQRDIRTLIKSKKNELLSYTKDFHLICKQSGIDVDSEQLQLAIALSKSLQTSESDLLNGNGTKNDKVLTANQRRGKIRTTLQEYGFKVPEIKKGGSKKIKKHSKKYKLLLTSDAEKQQIIADKYAQILLTNIPEINEERCYRCENTSSYLYYLTTAVSYEYIKNDDVFYVDNLVQKSLNNKHHMLRDWSEIPGRPVSPKIEVTNVCFRTIECTEEELTNILSGTIKTAQGIVKGRSNEINSVITEVPTNADYHNPVPDIEIKCQNSIDIIIKSNQTENKMSVDKECDYLVDSSGDDTSYKNIHIMTPPKNRSWSPDIFDDEVTLIMDSPKATMLQESSERTMVREQNDFMDLTECVGNLNSNNTNVNKNSYLSQGNNKTRINPNDVMDLTECVPTSSLRILNNIQRGNNNSEENNNPAIIKESCKIGTTDITQNPNLNNCLSNKMKNYCDNKSIEDDSVIIIDEGYCNENTDCQSNIIKSDIKSMEIVDLVGDTKHENGTLSNQRLVESDNLDIENNKQLSSPCEGSTGDISGKLNSLEGGKSISGADDILKEIRNPGITDLTQSSNSEDWLPLTGNDDLVEEATVEDQINSPIDTNRKSPKDTVDQNNSPVYMEEYDNNYRFDSTLNNIPISPSNDSDHSGVNNATDATEEYKNVNDLTQSSCSEDSLQIIQDTDVGSKSLDVTIALNDDDYYINNNLEINYPKFSMKNNSFKEFVNSRKDSHDSAVKSTNSKTKREEHDKVNDYDCEYVNVLENVPFKNKVQSPSTSARLCDENEVVSHDKYMTFDYNSIFENDPDIQNLECDVFPNYDSYATRGLEISIESEKLNQKYEKLNHDDIIESDGINSRNINPKNRDITGNNSLNTSETLTRCLNTIRGQDKSYISTDNDREFDNVLEHVSENKESTSLSSKSNVECDYKGNSPDSQSGEIDLTQQSDCTENIVCSPAIEIPDHESANNTSINYDEVYIEVNNRGYNDIPIETPIYENKVVEGNNSPIDKAVSGSSKTSEVFEISDDEFNYSLNQHKHDNESVRLDRTRFDIGGMTIIEEILNRKSMSTKSKLRCSCSDSEPNSIENKDKKCLPEVICGNSNDNLLGDTDFKKSELCSEVDRIATPLKSRINENVLFAQTPKHNDYIIKTDEVTPMPYYEMMTSPERNEQLDKYGIKPLKRKRAIEILTHIYNQTHPVMEIITENGEGPSPCKIRKKNNNRFFPRRAIAAQIKSIMSNDCTQVPGPSLQQLEPSSSLKSFEKLSGKSQKSPKRSDERPKLKNSNKENNLYEETKLLPDIRDIECCSEDWVFQKREKAKVHSCRVPLHIAFHNYVSCRRALREAILKYEPINIDDIHKGLVANGFRYNPKDILKFMDKKCITVKTADNARNSKKMTFN